MTEIKGRQPTRATSTDIGRSEVARYSARLGHRIRTLRLRKGLSAQQLATQAKVGLGTIYELEKGRHDPRLRTLLALQRALGAASLEELFDEVPDPPSLTMIPGTQKE
ncbi:MAG: helix-turn-helix transcriptional regulator [Actinomycetota bacterium]